MNRIKFTSSEVEEELKRQIYINNYFKLLRSTIFILIIIMSVCVLIASVIFPVLTINEYSMSPTLKKGDVIVAFKTKRIKKGDIIAFYHGNKILVKRVVAKSGEWVTVDDEGNVYVDSKLLDESYINKKSYGITDIEYPYQVKSEGLFVLSDNRENSIDSRTKDIGCISYENIVGKVLFKVWPFR